MDKKLKIRIPLGIFILGLIAINCFVAYYVSSLVFAGAGISLIAGLIAGTAPNYIYEILGVLIAFIFFVSLIVCFFKLFSFKRTFYIYFTLSFLFQCLFFAVSYYVLSMHIDNLTSILSSSVENIYPSLLWVVIPYSLSVIFLFMKKDTIFITDKISGELPHVEE